MSPKDFHQLPGPVKDAALCIAIEHVSWCIHVGQSLEQIWRCIGVVQPIGANWNELIETVAAVHLGFKLRDRAWAERELRKWAA